MCLVLSKAGPVITTGAAHKNERAFMEWWHETTECLMSSPKTHGGKGTQNCTKSPRQKPGKWVPRVKVFTSVKEYFKNTCSCYH